MAKVKTFENLALANAWKLTAEKGGTRGDVVLALMTEAGVADSKETRSQWYNNVSQRVKALTEAGVTFPALKAGQRGGHKGARSVADIAAVFATPTV